MNAIPSLRRYVSGASIAPSEAAAVLRLAFAAMFMGQIAVALLVALVVTLTIARPDGAHTVLAIVLVVLSVLQGPLGVAAALAPLPEPDRVRRAALQRTLLVAVLLSTPGWYLAFLFATGGGGWPIFALVALLAAYGFFGLLAATRLGVRAAEG